MYRDSSGSSSTITSTVQGVLGNGDHASVNNLGEAVWMTLFQPGVGHEIVSSVHGTIAVGLYPDINDLGDIVFYREVSTSKKVVVLWQNGVETIIDPGAFNALPFPTINNCREIAFAASSFTGQQGVFVAVPEADYDGDDDADGLDFLEWQRDFGLTVASPFDGADGTGDGVVDDCDLRIWERTLGRDFSNPLVAAGAIPEPTSTALVLAALGLFVTAGRRQSRGTG